MLSGTHVGPKEAGEEGHTLPVLGRLSVLQGGSHMLGTTASKQASKQGVSLDAVELGFLGTLLCVLVMAFAHDSCGSGSSVQP